MPSARSCAKCHTPADAGDVCARCGSVEFIDTPAAAGAAHSTDPSLWSVPRRAGRPAVPGYVLGEVLGRGGMGVVYEADQVKAGRRVAVKVIQAFGGIDPRQRERFDTEALALGRLSHPNVVGVYEVGECEDGGPFFTMELLPGGTLADRVRDGRTVPPDEAARLAAAAADGVAAAHAVGVLHRDLKPGNVLVAADGTPKVCDFGLAKLRDGPDGGTVSGARIGTVKYMSPEQFRGARDLDEQTDVFGLGATLYHLLTGHPPFADAGPVANRPDPKPPKAVNPAVDGVLDAVVRKALAEDRRDRYPSAAALAADLRSWAAGQPTAARPPTRAKRLRRWAGRNGWAVAAGLLVFLAAVAAAVDRDLRREADPELRMRRTLAGGGAWEAVGGDGAIPWHAWRLDGGTTNTEGPADARRCVHSRGFGLLELVSDPMTDRYRVTVEWKFLGVPADHRGGGLYLGAVTVPQPDGELATRVVGFNYRDTAEPRVDMFANCFMYFSRPGRTSTMSYKEFDRVPGPAVATGWHSVVVEVAPDGMAVRRGADGVNAIPETVTIPADWIDAQAAELAKRLRADGVPHTRPPNWIPRCPLGIYVDNASMAVRRFHVQTLIPNP